MICLQQSSERNVIPGCLFLKLNHVKQADVDDLVA